ncbi:A/G-specific adenine glycosylase [Desulfosarcina ovata]|nr:A/G-specific adenine glycosylase [Desulfosarcina ovata]
MQPEAIGQNLLDWYAAHQRRLPWRETSDPWAIWISEVMLQQTQVATAIPYYHRFMHRFPTPRHLAGANVQEVLKLWEGLGYYSRARHLHRAAGVVVSRYHGQVPDDPAIFRTLPGVGDYIAAAVLSIAFGRVIAVVDGNVKRVLARLFELEHPVNRSGSHKFFQPLADRLITPHQPADFNQAMMELGALVCRPKNPDCGHCPLFGLCRANRNRTTADYPRRDAARKRPHRHLAIGVIVKEDKLLVVQRPMDGFLGGLWEFPAIPAMPGENADRAIETELADEIGLRIGMDRLLTRIRHAYTHFTLSADVYLCRYLSGRIRLKRAQSHRWVTFRSLQRLPLHKANHKFLEDLKNVLGKG